MKCRYRWYTFDGGFSCEEFQEISSKMLAMQYAEAKAFGFRLSTANTAQIQGEFIEELHDEVEVRSPLGGVYKYSSVNFNLVQFKLLRQPLALRLTNPPRRLQPLFMELKAICGSAPIHPAVDLRKWLDRWLMKRSDVVVSEIAFADMPVGRATRAAIRFESPDDVRQDVSRFLSGREPAISSIVFEFDDGDSRGKCELRVNCSAIITAWRPSEIADDLWSFYLTSLK
jgi:hypothetical protein